VANELEHILRDELMSQLLDKIDRNTLADLVVRVTARELDPYAAARQLLNRSYHKEEVVET
jgi:hypothetical protein